VRRLTAVSKLPILAGVALAALAMVLIPAATAGSNKTFTVSVTPNPAVGGVSQAFTYTIANAATSPNQLGSADVTPPNGFTATNVSGYPINYITSDGVVHLRNLNLAPGSPPAVITITATASCTDPGSLAWSSKAKQSNNFSGTPGNNFSPYPLLTGQSVTPCKLAFASQPGDTPSTTRPGTRSGVR